jgi:hypothetical protein
MDPMSIASLIGAVLKTGWAITNFTTSCIEAKSDLLAVRNELNDLEKVLKLLQAEVADDNIPQTLKAGIASTLQHMAAVVEQVEELVKSNSGKIGSVRWTLSGKNRAAALRSQLSAYRDSLSLTLDMMALSLSKNIKSDTTTIKSDTTAIRTKVTEIKTATDQIPQLIQEGLRRGYTPQPPQTVAIAAAAAPVSLASSVALITSNPRKICGVFCQGCKNGTWSTIRTRTSSN